MFLGRVVKSGEPLWLPDDRAWALAFMDHEADRGPCGQPHSESTRPENEDAYTVDEIGFCHACEALRAKAEGVPPGALFSVRLRSVSAAPSDQHV